MVTNLYFNNWGASGEQRLIDDLIIESIKMYGIDVWYLPRTMNAIDGILNEDDLPTFTKAYMLEMYIRNVDSFAGEGDILSRFGLEIRDSMTLTMSQRRFAEEVTLNQVDIPRPREGDLVFFPLNGKIFEIRHVEHEAIFYQMGSLQTYDIKTDLFEYSNERFSTGIEQVDALTARYDTTTDAAIANVETVDVWADNIKIQNEATPLIDFSEADPFSEAGTY